MTGSGAKTIKFKAVDAKKILKTSSKSIYSIFFCLSLSHHSMLCLFFTSVDPFTYLISFLKVQQIDRVVEVVEETIKGNDIPDILSLYACICSLDRYRN